LVKGKAELPAYYRSVLRFLHTIRRELRDWRKTSLQFAMAKCVFHWQARKAYLRIRQAATGQSNRP
jgi:hypothetical protein